MLHDAPRFSIFSISLVVASLVPLPAGLAADAGRPNIVYIMADDLGWADVGFNGAKFYETPAMFEELKEWQKQTKAVIPSEPNPDFGRQRGKSKQKSNNRK